MIRQFSGGGGGGSMSSEIIILAGRLRFVVVYLN